MFDVLSTILSGFHSSTLICNGCSAPTILVAGLFLVSSALCEAVLQLFFLRGCCVEQLLQAVLARRNRPYATVLRRCRCRFPRCPSSLICCILLVGVEVDNIDR